MDVNDIWFSGGGRLTFCKALNELNFVFITFYLPVRVFLSLPLILCHWHCLFPKRLGLLPVSTLESVPGVLAEQAIGHDSTIKKLKI